MMQIHAIALFRLSVLGSLTSRHSFVQGELKQLIRELASRSYNIPNSQRCYLSEKTIEAWFYAWRRGGIDALAPKPRRDSGESKIPSLLQEAILTAKRENPKRSINVILRLMANSQIKGGHKLTRSSIHRLLQQHGISRMQGSASEVEEFRSFVAEHAGDIWYSDAMHGPKVAVNGRLRKTYLISFMDDASRLITHSTFCLGEKALDVERVLRQALLRRGLPNKLVIDNGPAYRAKSLQGVCARLKIPLLYCRPYRPESKGKLERWHRVVRAQFVSELTSQHLNDLDSLNSYLLAWIEKSYHCNAHSALQGQSPLQRWQKDLDGMRSLGPFAANLDEIFYHRESRKVRRDGTISLWGRFFEVPYALSGRTIYAVIDPHLQQVISLESSEGKPLGKATPLDKLANNTRRRRQPSDPEAAKPSVSAPTLNTLDQAYQRHHDDFYVDFPNDKKER